MWGQQVGITELVFAMTKILYFDPAFFHQRLETEVDAAETNAELSCQCALTHLRRLVQTTQHLELDLLLETSCFLSGGCRVHIVLGTLPPCRVTIGKRG